ncbi:MAG: pyrroline-5-carboxylate reductase [Acidimicrobiia bacterium]|nr:pyrroline-5-carboxylate reductase [Acidimicrobiia bacterium]MDH4307555.1 pyrroline-5-carboxylate reductase [Acidimicrobiia bacterium]MDH5293783.1 pyrroline-5-carboxylate reductase [Acidimicrobiia bacterium]
MRPSVAVLGVGAMGEAIVRGLLSAGWESDELTAAVRRETRLHDIETRIGVECHLDSNDAVEGRSVIVVAVKPRDVPHLLDRVAKTITTEQVVISLAAGVPISLFEEKLSNVPVVRAMPNTPSLVREGVTAIAGGHHVTEDHLARARRVLEAVGQVEVMDESLIDAVTAVSGSGPAYIFLLAEALEEAAVREGLPRDIAEALVHQTVRGAGHLLTDTPVKSAELRAQVTSPGGTTAAAIHILEERGFRAVIEDAVRAAAQRSRELGTLAQEDKS